MHPISYIFLKRFFLFASVSSLLTIELYAQSTSWTGATNTDWNTNSNWSAGVPLSTTDVFITNVTNDPVISSAAVAQTVYINAGALLTISATFSLTIIGSTATQSIWNIGTLSNYGIININSSVSVGNYGIFNQATLNNYPGAVINIDRCLFAGLLNSGTLANDGTIIIGATTSVATYGIYNIATFNNNNGGIIKIDRSIYSGIYNTGVITNVATITIGAVANIGNYCFINEATVNNNTGGVINLDRASNNALFNNGIINNLAMINIGATAVSGSFGINNQNNINNNSGGIINIDQLIDGGIYNNGTITNVATINIGTLSSIGYYGIYNDATFNNNANGIIKIDRSSLLGISKFNGTFTNNASITIGAIVPIVNLIIGDVGAFINNTGGILNGTGNLPGTNFYHTAGTLSPGYSSGKMTFTTSSNFTNSTLSMEAVSAGGVGGIDFDQIVITGTATVGASTYLNLKFNYAIECKTTFDVLTATSVVGTIPTGNISFSNVGPGNVTAVSVSYPGGNTIRITVTTPLDTKVPVFNCATLTTINYYTQAPNCINNSDVGIPVAVDLCEGNINGIGSRSDNATINAPWPLGTTIITWNFIDASSNVKTCTQNVIVNDVDIPLIIRNGLAVVDICEDDTYIDAGATANDNCDGNLTSNIVTFNPVNTSIPATYTVTYNVSDAAINAAFQVTRSVIVHPLPATTCPSDFTICKTSGNVTLSGASPVGGSFSGAGVSGGIFDPLVAGAGMHTITYSYTDANACIGTCTFVITVFNPPILNVSDGMYYCTLAEAISSSNTNDGEEIRVPAGTYMDACLMVNKSLKFTAVGGPVIMNCFEMNGSGKDMTLGSNFTINTLTLTLGKVHTNGYNLKCGTILHTSGSDSYVVTD